MKNLVKKIKNLVFSPVVPISGKIGNVGRTQKLGLTASSQKYDVEIDGRKLQIDFLHKGISEKFLEAVNDGERISIEAVGGSETFVCLSITMASGEIHNLPRLFYCIRFATAAVLLTVVFFTAKALRFFLIGENPPFYELLIYMGIGIYISRKYGINGKHEFWAFCRGFMKK